MRKLSYFLVITALSAQIFNAGCSTMKPVEPEAPDPAAIEHVEAQQAAFDGENLVAADLVNVLRQIPALRPGQRGLSIDNPQSNFERHLERALISAGYRISASQGDESVPHLRSIVTLIDNSDNDDSEGILKTYQLDVADIKIKRDYLFERDQVRPNPKMYFKGVEAAGIQLDNSIFQLAAQVHNTANTQPSNGHASQLHPASRHADNAMKSAEMPLQLRLNPLTPAENYAEGDTISLVIESTSDSNIHCYYQDGLGNVVRLFPNRFQQDNTLRAGHTLLLPESDKWELVATRSGVSESFLCIASAPELSERLASVSSQPDLQPLPAKDLQQIYDDFRSVAGDDLTFRTLSLAVQ